MNRMAAVPTRRFTRVLLDSHSLVGVVFGALVYLICLSGSLTVVADEFERWERPDAPAVVRHDPALLGRTAVNAAAAAHRARADEVLYINAGNTDLPRMTVVAVDRAGGHHAWNVDAGGRLLPRAIAPWTEFLREHHESLNLPDPFGGWVVGLIGTSLLASLFSGLLAHRRIVKDAFRLRWGGSKRLANADLHNRIGVWALPFHFIVALTGSLLGLASLIILVLALVAFRGDRDRAIGALTGPPAVVDTRPAPLPDVAAIATAVSARLPGAQIEGVNIEHPLTAGQRVQVLVAAPGHLSRAEQWTFSGDGRLQGTLGLTTGSVGMRVFGMLAPLHYGTYGGILLKLVYLVLGLGMATLVATGTQILLARRREQGRASPVWERVWDGVVWGQPIALLASALAAIGAGLEPVPAYWGVAVLIVAIAGLVRQGLRRLYWLISGLGCLALAMTQALLAGLDGLISVGIEAALSGMAILFVTMAWKNYASQPGLAYPRHSKPYIDAGG